MLTSFLLVFQTASTPVTPHADLWIPECRQVLSSEGPRGYRTCARAALREREFQMELREEEYRELLQASDRSAALSRFQGDRQTFIAYRQSHCDYFAKEFGRVPVLEANRWLSCQYHLTDRRVAELNSMIVLFNPIMDEP
ncbi:MAG: lysozyme inhibitor LprI family protein [Pseudomonadota bacterium]